MLIGQHDDTIWHRWTILFELVIRVIGEIKPALFKNAIENFNKRVDDIRNKMVFKKILVDRSYLANELKLKVST